MAPFIMYKKAVVYLIMIHGYANLYTYPYRAFELFDFT